MNPDMNQQGFPPNEFYDNYQSSGSNSSNWQESATRFRGHGHYQAPYPTFNPRMRQPGDSQRGRYPYRKRGGAHRPYNRDRNSDQQHEQSSDNPESQKPTTDFSNRNFNSLFRPNMLENPWFNMKPTKVPSNGTTLVFDSTTY